MKRILSTGPGASGKSTLARQLSALTGLRVVELDKLVWQQGLKTIPRDTKRKLVAESAWNMDGDFGPYDEIEIRLRGHDYLPGLRIHPMCVTRD
jgi:cytidylate kinase